MKITAKVKLDAGFNRKFNKDVLTELSKTIKRKAELIKVDILGDLRKYVKEALTGTPEYQSLTHGKLRGELGITEADSRASAIVDTWVNSISVNVKAATKPFLTIDIGAIKQDYQDVLSLPVSSYKTEKGEPIPWLSWLLLEGDKRIIRKYEFTGNITRNSRTGQGIMIKKKKAFWQVPPEFSGTSTNNFVTRGLQDIEAEIDLIVEKAIKGNLK